jgi:hypothetical protein|tara:strand:+ start:3171 stop:3539 length:369 start_codon:yes stop_codon:yes gene_type:complete
VPVAVGAGVLVDADHLVDQIWHFYMHKRPAAILALHGWEWLAALGIVSAVLEFPWWMVAATFGYGSHVITDQIFNGVHRWGYSIAFRVHHRFRVERFSDRWRLKRPVDALINELRVGRRTPQ